jgi:hypothetical protein
MTDTLMYVKIAGIVRKLFDRKTAAELKAIKQHFSAAYSDAQLCALVLIGMTIRVFGLAPEPPKGSRSIWPVIGALVEFLKSLSDLGLSRSGPNPLDEIVSEGCQQFAKITPAADLRTLPPPPSPLSQAPSGEAHQKRRTERPTNSTGEPAARPRTESPH